MQTCRTCGQWLPLEDFHRNKRMPSGRVNHCKKCAIPRYAEGRSIRAKRDRAYFQQIKVDRGCTDCGYNANPVALDFDHLPGSEKLYRVCTMAGMKREMIDAEIAKCEVVCANCHRIRTNERLKSPEQIVIEFPPRRKGFHG